MKTRAEKTAGPILLDELFAANLPRQSAAGGLRLGGDYCPTCGDHAPLCSRCGLCFVNDCCTCDYGSGDALLESGVA